EPDKLDRVGHVETEDRIEEEERGREPADEGRYQAFEKSPQQGRGQDRDEIDRERVSQVDEVSQRHDDECRRSDKSEREQHMQGERARLVRMGAIEHARYTAGRQAERLLTWL